MTRLSSPQCIARLRLAGEDRTCFKVACLWLQFLYHIMRPGPKYQCLRLRRQLASIVLSAWTQNSSHHVPLAGTLSAISASCLRSERARSAPSAEKSVESSRSFAFLTDSLQPSPRTVRCRTQQATVYTDFYRHIHTITISSVFAFVGCRRTAPLA